MRMSSEVSMSRQGVGADSETVVPRARAARGRHLGLAANALARRRRPGGRGAAGRRSSCVTCSAHGRASGAGRRGRRYRAPLELAARHGDARGPARAARGVGLAGARPARPARAGRARADQPDPRGLSGRARLRPRAGARPRGPPAAGAGPRPVRPHPHRRAGDARGDARARSRPSGCARPRSTPTRRCAPPEGLAAEAAEIGLALLGRAGGARRRWTPSARRSPRVLAAEALAHGDMGLAVALLAPAGVAAALARFGDAGPAGHLPARVHRRRRRARRARAARAGARWPTRSRRRPPPAATAADWVLGRREGARPARRHRGPAARRSATTEDGPARCSWSRPPGVTADPEPAMGVRAAATARVRLDGRAAPGATRSCARATTTPSCVAPGPAGLVRAGRRHRPRRPRLRHPVRQRAHARSASRSPTARPSPSPSPTSRSRLEGMRLTTLRAAAPGRPGQAGRARHRARPPAVRGQGRGDRLPRRPAARRPRLRQGAPRRALVPRPARGRRHGRRAARLMIDLEAPRSSAGSSRQAHQVAENVLRPISRKYDRGEHDRPGRARHARRARSTA